MRGRTMNFTPALMASLFDTFTNVWGKGGHFVSPFISTPPLVLRIRITNRCNLSCYYCYLGKSLNIKSENLSLKEWRFIIDKLPSNTLIDITGGEPFLTPEFSKIMELLLERKFKVSLITNGTINKPEVFESFVRNELAHFMISIDGTEDIHDVIRGRGSFKKAISTAQQILRLREKYQKTFPKLVAKVTVTEVNALQLEKFSSYLIDEIGFDGITLNLLFQNKSRDGFPDATDEEDIKFLSGNEVKFDERMVEELTSSVLTTREKYPGRIQVRPDISNHNLRAYFKEPSRFSAPNCYKYRSIVTLYSDGVLTPCDLGLNVGNIRDIDYDIGTSVKLKKMQSFYRFMSSKKSQNLPGCEGCCLKKHQLKSEHLS